MKNFLRFGLPMLAFMLIASAVAFALPADAYAAVHADGMYTFLHHSALGVPTMLGGCVSVTAIRSSTCGANPGGTTKLQVIAYEDVESIPEPGSDGVTVTGDIVPKTGKGFAEWEFAQDTGGLQFNGAGEIGSQAIEVINDVYIPSMSPEIAAVINASLNRRFIIIVTDARGRKMIGGDMIRPMTLEPKYDSGKKFNDKNGSTFTFKCGSFHVPYYYEGVVPVAAPTV